MEKTKICTRCGEEKPATSEYFKIDKRRKSGIAGTCKCCKNKDSKLYRKANKEALKRYQDNNKEYMKQWRESNKELLHKYNKQYYKDNNKLLREKNRRYFKANREKINILIQKYEARKMLLPASLTPEQWEKIKRQFNNKCAYCGKEKPLAQEHFVPVNAGGEYTHNNIICACQSCNSSKGKKSFFTWYPKFKHYSKQREAKILKYLGYNNGIQQFSLI